MRPVSVIGLFSGAGGLEIGAHWAGADVRVSVDNDSCSCQTLRGNASFHSGNVLEADICTLNGKELRNAARLAPHDPCIVVGGPPCQPFSKASYWTDPGHDSRYRRARARGIATVPKPAPITQAKSDDRRSLVDEFWRLILEVKADGFLFENVPSITHPRNRQVLEKLIESAEAAGFRTTLDRVNAVEFGVPQRRNRVILLGLKGSKLAPPERTHSEAPFVERTLFQDGVLRVVTAGEALAPFAHEKYFEPEEIVTGRWEKHLREVPPGQNYKALTEWAGHPDPAFEAETRFWHFLLKLSPELPSWTIPANPGPWVGPFHWESRRLRTAELAALQSFPVGYVFAGNRRDRVRQIGNAVPPLLAQKLMEPLLSALAGSRPVSRSGRRAKAAEK